MMTRYRIGRIEGRWKNFIPPIQGGAFRPVEEINEDLDEPLTRPSSSLDASLSSSQKSSRTPSPVFDCSEPKLRARREANELTGPTASRSTAPAETRQDKDIAMAFLDSQTKEQISLDLDRYPSLDEITQDTIVAKYRLLYRRIKDEGLFDCNYGAYAAEVARYTLLFGLMLLCLQWRWFALGGVFMGLFWHQLVFSAHDAGHMGITHNFHVDTVIGIIISDFLGGLSMGWWKRNHNVHHIVTNSPEHDPDIEHMPFFAVSHRFLQSLRSSYYDRVMEYDVAARFLVRIQPYTYHFVLLFGRFNLYRLSWEYLLTGQAPQKGPAWWHRHLEVAGNICFWIWFGYGILYLSIPTNWDRFVFVMVSHMVTMPLHLQITLSHFAMSCADLGPNESFPQRMLRTTMDVDCPQWLDFIHGGLQFQAIHHLYPRLPRHNLRRAQRLVQDFCREVGIPYALYGFVDGNKEVIGRLAEVSRQAAIFAQCQRVVAGGEPPIRH